MPFKSRKQERYLQINEPDIYEDWVEEYGHFKGAEAFSADFLDPCYVFFGKDDEKPILVKGLELTIGPSNKGWAQEWAHIQIEQNRTWPSKSAAKEAFMRWLKKEKCWHTRQVMKWDDVKKYGALSYEKYNIPFEEITQVRIVEDEVEWDAESFSAEENEMCPSCERAKISQDPDRYLVCPLCDWRSDEPLPCRHLNLEITDTDYDGEFEGGVMVYARCEDCYADGQAFGVWEFEDYNAESFGADDELLCDGCDKEGQFPTYAYSHGAFCESCIDRIKREEADPTFGYGEYAESFSAELKRDSCCCGATKSKPCACMIEGVMECNATCPCSLEKGAESFGNCWICEDNGLIVEGTYRCGSCGRDWCGEPVNKIQGWVGEGHHRMGLAQCDNCEQYFCPSCEDGEEGRVDLDGPEFSEYWNIKQRGWADGLPPYICSSCRNAEESFSADVSPQNSIDWEKVAAEEWRAGYPHTVSLLTYQNKQANKSLLSCLNAHLKIAKDEVSMGHYQYPDLADETITYEYEEKYGRKPTREEIDKALPPLIKGLRKQAKKGIYDGETWEELSEALKSPLSRFRWGRGDYTGRKGWFDVGEQNWSAESFSAEEGDKCPYCYCGHENLSLDSQPPYFDGEVAWVEIQCDDCNMKATAPTYDFEFDEQGILKDVGLPLAVNMSAPNYGTLRCDSCHTRFQQAAESFSAEHFDDVSPLDGPCKHCGHDMFTESHKSWFCDRKSGGCGIVAHFVNPFGAESFSVERDFACADCGEVIIDDDYEVSDEGATLCGGQFGNNCADAESFHSYKVAPDLSSYTKAELLSSIAGPQGTAAYQEVVYDPIAQSRLSAEGVSSFSPTRLMVLGASIGVALGLYTTRGD